MRPTIRLALGALLFATTFPGVAEEPSVELLWVGAFHGEDITAQAGSEWLALVENEEGYTLRRVEVQIETVFDGMVDAEGEASGKEVRVDLPEEPLFLVRGTEFCMPGQVPTVSLARSFVYPGQELALTLSREASWRLRAYGSVERGADLRIRDYMIELAGRRHGDRGQIIYAAEGGVSVDYLHPIWAGDLDGDGSIDILLETSNHYNLTEYTLYLSSAAGEGDFVKRVAVFRATGC